jgi:hypothetical protein
MKALQETMFPKCHRIPKTHVLSVVSLKFTVLMKIAGLWEYHRHLAHVLLDEIYKLSLSGSSFSKYNNINYNNKEK